MLTPAGARPEQALLRFPRRQGWTGSACVEGGRWTGLSWGRDTSLHAPGNLIGTRECSVSRPGAGGQRHPADTRSANILGRKYRRHLYSRGGTVRQPSLKTVGKRDGCVGIPIRSRIFPFKFARSAGSRGLFAGCAPLRLANDQAVIRQIELQGRRLK